MFKLLCFKEVWRMSKVLTFRMSEKEIYDIKVRAMNLDLTVSQYLRLALKTLRGKG